MNIIKCGSQT